MKVKLFLISLFIFYICIFCYIFLVFIRILLLISESFCVLFPHVKLTEEAFYLKYENFREELFFLDFLQIYWEEFFFYFYTDLTWMKIYFLCVFFFFIISTYLVNKYSLKLFGYPNERISLSYLSFEHYLKSKKKKEKICLNSNLLNYNLFLQGYFERLILRGFFSKEDFLETKKNLCFNILELSFVLFYGNLKKNKNIVREKKICAERKLQKNFGNLIDFANFLEYKHYIYILEMLEKNDKNSMQLFIKKLLINTSFCEMLEN